MMEVEFRLRARREIEQAAEWYDDRAKDLGDAFLRAIDDTIERIRLLPHGCPRIPQNLAIRRAKVIGFPYGLFYAIGVRTVVILGVVHRARKSPFDRRT
jgi:plasmid stabilization system protein ParE